MDDGRLRLCSRSTRNQDMRVKPYRYFLHACILLAILDYFVCTFVMGASSQSDGILIPGPSKLCIPPPYLAAGTNQGMTGATWLIREDTRTWQQISGSPSRWLISCWSLMNETSMLWYGELNNLTFILLNQHEIAVQLITAMVQPQAQPTTVSDTTINTNSLIASSVYLLTVSGSSTSLFAVDLITHNLTKITMQPPTKTIDPFTLLEVNGTLILAQTIDVQAPQPILPLPLTLLLYNLHTGTWTTVTSATSPCRNFTALTYDRLSTTLTAVCGNAMYSCRLSALNLPLSDDSLNCQPFFQHTNNSSQIPSQIYYLRAGDQLFSVGADSAILAHTISNRDNVTYYDQGYPLLDPVLQPDLCILQGVIISRYLVPNTLLWNDVRQTLYVGCSVGSAATISIQSTRTESPIVTSLISTDICSQTQSPLGIGIGTSSSKPEVTLLAQCVEGLFFTSGRSLHLITRLKNLDNVFVLNPLTHASYMSIRASLSNRNSDPTPPTPTAPTLYQVTAVHVKSILTWSDCAPINAALAMDDGKTWLTICADMKESSPACVRQFIMDDESSMLKVSPNVTCLFSLTQKLGPPGGSQPKLLVYWTMYGWYLLSTPQILYWPALRNNTNSSYPTSLPDPIAVVLSSDPQANLTHTDLQIEELDDGTLMVGCESITTAGPSQQTTIYRVTIDDPSHPERWNTRVFWENFFGDFDFVIEKHPKGGKGARLWFLEWGQVLTCVDIGTGLLLQSHDFGDNSYVGGFALDPLHHRVFIASMLKKSSIEQVQLMHLNVIDAESGVMTQTISPSNVAAPYMRAMLVDPITATLTIMLQSDLSPTSQIVVYSEQWTCSAGMQWVDGSCEVCGMSTSRGFISYENATVVTPQCEPCAKGRYSNNTGNPECRACDPGRYSTATGTILCSYCQPNYYNNISGSKSQCSPCSSGQETKDSLGFGSTICYDCELGQFNDPGAPCQTCPINSYSPSLGGDCVTCTDQDQEGLLCINGIARVTAGWWAYKLSPAPYARFLTTQCPPNYCPGSNLQVDPFFCAHPRLNSHDNWLCAECVSDHIPWGSSCDPCPQADAGLIILIIVIAILLVFFLLRASSAAGPVTILVFFIQVAALEVGPVTKWIDWIQFANFGAHSVRSCLLPIMPITQNILTMLVPLMLFVILVLLCCTNYRLSIYFTDRDTSQANRLVRTIDGLTRDFSIDRYIGCSMAILIFCYTSVTVTCVQSLHCTHVAPKVDRLFSAPTVDCHSFDYKFFLLPVAVIILIGYVIGFPLAMFVFLWRSSPMLQNLSAGGFDSTSAEATKFAARWSHFYRPYRGAVWYWQPIAMFRRFIFALISVLLLASPPTKYVMYGVFGLVSLTFHSLLHPFIESRSNHFESVSYLLLIFLAYLLTNISPPFGIGIQIVLFLLIVPFSLILMVAILVTALRNIQSKPAPARMSSVNLSSSRSSSVLPPPSLHDALLHDDGGNFSHEAPTSYTYL